MEHFIARGQVIARVFIDTVVINEACIFNIYINVQLKISTNESDLSLYFSSFRKSDVENLTHQKLLDE